MGDSRAVGFLGLMFLGLSGVFYLMHLTLTPTVQVEIGQVRIGYGLGRNDLASYIVFGIAIMFFITAGILYFKKPKLDVEREQQDQQESIDRLKKHLEDKDKKE